MSRIGFSIVPLILVVLLSVFFYMSPSIFGQKASDNTEALQDLINKRFLSIGNSIAHATFVLDAILGEEYEKLNEIITTLKSDEQEITEVNFTDAKNNIIASSDPNRLGKVSSSTIPASGKSAVQRKSEIIEGAFNISIGATRVGAVYLKAKPIVPVIKVSNAPNPVVLGVGAVFALIAFFVTFSMSRSFETKLVDDINKRQEEVFLPKIDSLKNESAQAQKNLDDIKKKTDEAQQVLTRISAEYQEKKREIESNPVVLSLEKLKAAEVELIKRLELLKKEEIKIQNEFSLLKQQREDIQHSLESERKEESVLREKLDLIKKKILHLESPGK